MTQPALDYFTRRMVAIKAETTEGTDASPSTSVNTFDLLNGSSGTEIDKVERKRDRSFFTNDPFVATNKRAFVEGDIELVPPTTPGSATTAGNAPVEPALLPCALAVTKSSTNSTTIYAPISASIPTVTAAFYHAGTLIKAVGSRGNISALMMEVGGRFMGKLRLQGVHSTVTEVTLPTDGVYTAFTAPTVVTYSNSIARAFGSTASTAVPVHVWSKSLMVDFGNELKTVQYTQKRISGISDRNATFKMLIARTAIADFDCHALRDAGTAVRFDFTIVDDDGVRYTRLPIRAQIETIKDADQDGYRFYELAGPCIASDSGGDEFTIEYGLVSLRLVGTLPGQAAGVYSQSLSLQGLSWTPVTYTVFSGTLPAGTTLSATTGVVSGTATAGSTTCVIRATGTDATGATITANSSSQVIVIT